MVKVTVHTHETLEIEGAHVVAAFPSVGLVATIGANFMVEQLGLQQVGVMDSPRFPTLSVVERGEPLNPVRIYAGTFDRDGKQQPLVVFLSEFQPHPELVRAVSEAIIDWAKANGAAAIVTPEGLLLEGGESGDDVAIYAAASTPEMRQRLEDVGAPLFKEGIVAGVTGVLLNLGKRDRFPVVAVLSEARQGQPDARSAATVVDLLAKLTGATLDTGKLYDEAAKFEAQVDEMMRRQKLQEGDSTMPTSVMYG